MLEEIYLVLLIEKYEYDYCAFKFSSDHQFTGLCDDVSPYFLNIINNLISKKILIPNEHPNYSIPYSIDDFGNVNFKPTLNNTTWIINFDFCNLSEYRKLIKTKRYSDDEKYYLWELVYKEEIIKYLAYQNQKYFNGIIKKDVVDVFLKNLILEFSLIEAFAIIYYSAILTSKYLQTTGAVSGMVNKYFVDRIFDHIVEKDRNKLSNFEHLHKFEQSEVSSYITDWIFKDKNFIFARHKN